MGDLEGTSWIERSLTQIGRDARPAEVERISAALNAAGERLTSQWAGQADLSAVAHRKSCLRWVTAVGVDGALAEAMYEALCDAADNVCAIDVETTLGVAQGSRGEGGDRQ
ncbi:hypothetical protein ABT255_43130 [Streptomyces mirabilis]|uniref:hypothetical protein n=1 Tax=Streptomyces mirabilis TaxID=68239 RepID=UPI00332FA1C6